VVFEERLAHLDVKALGLEDLHEFLMPLSGMQLVELHGHAVNALPVLRL
jgi:hypothetical protein